jgi:hypothetical protein
MDRPDEEVIFVAIFTVNPSVVCHSFTRVWLLLVLILRYIAPGLEHG